MSNTSSQVFDTYSSGFGKEESSRVSDGQYHTDRLEAQEAVITEQQR